ncbi:MAG: EscU/YscU/HrcU family type III secretion system export apparatus switch protein [Synergistaceae bacterium]|jgi:flagellar biosynthesis protein|nr:EscU/YscU/HrcU family type III secretion system export apparatus switch protein [Synergistaceae bacterium]
MKKAAALRYDERRDALPKVTAQGRGKTAERIIDIAVEAEIPIIEDAALVSALLMLELGDEIPVELYRTVAKILAFLYETDRRDEMS